MLGKPGLGWRTMGLAVTALSFSSRRRCGAGPLPPMRPTMSAPQVSSCLMNQSGSAPKRACPSSLVVMSAAMGRPPTSCTARMAWWISFRSSKPSRTMRSAPASMRGVACWRKRARASSKEVGPQGSMRTPRGPMHPATQARAPCWAMARRASSTPWRLMASSSPSRPRVASFKRPAPQVLVVSTWAPAARNSPWMASRRSGDLRLHSSKLRCSVIPRSCRAVAVLPSKRKHSPASRACWKVGWVMAAPGRDSRLIGIQVGSGQSVTVRYLPPGRAEGRSWHLAVAGCQGFTGPFPPPFWITL